ncbi:MAG: rRNA cytosine-C5-methyltransferase [Flavobacteriia bacterium]|nr:rRNA cytosine-C5-methyltransferase [Flavobacteriia bacterium]
MNRNFKEKYFPFKKEFSERAIQDPFLGQELLVSLDNDPLISVRCHPFKKFDLSLLPIKKKVSWTENCYYLDTRPSYTLDPLFHSACYYPQEAGSMFLETILKELDIKKDSTILDLCAAPGGKSQILASFLEVEGLLLSNEIIVSRAKILVENMIKWGGKHTFVCQNKPEDFKHLPNLFDLILCDVPCSGEGLFRKDKKSRNEWNENLVEFCSLRQRKIVMDIWTSLKEEGFLIYSTCTFNETENEQNVQWFIKQTNAELIQIKHQGLKTGRNGIGFYALPSESEAEGIYFAILKKKSQTNIQIKKQNQKSYFNYFKNKSNIDFKVQNHCCLFQKEKLIFTFNEKQLALIQLLASTLNLLKTGTIVADIIGEKWIPSHSLAMDIKTLSTEINMIEVNKEQALQYLKGNSFSLNLSKGHHLLSYRKIPLGWIHHVDKRFNSLYPKDWRIRMKI